MPETEKIEIASLENYDELSKLFLASYPVLMKADSGLAGYSKEELDLALPFIAKPNKNLLSSNTFYIIRDQSNKLQACGGWTPDRPGDGSDEKNVAHIRHFATHPNAIRKGYGRKIIQNCIEQARLSSFTSMECYSSLNAEKFYAAMGFRRESAITVTLGNGVLFPAILMKQKL